MRIHEWADHTATLRINGEAVSITAGTFACIEREWKDSDRIEADFPYHLYGSRMEDRPEYISVFYGSHLLVACTEGFAEFDGTRQVLLNSLVPAGKPNEFETVFKTGRTVFRPICDVVEEEYNGYTIITKPVPFPAAFAPYRAKNYG